MTVTVAPKLVALDSIPENLYATADASLIDTTLNNKEILEDSTDNTVGSSDSLKFNYNLNFVRGSQNWKDIIANIQLPTNISTVADTSGNIAYINYSDGTVEPISQAEVTSGTLKHTLANQIGKNIGSHGDSAIITINAKADTVTTDTTVKKAPATFTGSNEISTTNSPVFKILAPKNFKLNLTNPSSSNNLDLLFNSKTATLNLPTEINYSDNHSFGDTSKNTNISYQIKIGDKTYNVASNATGTKFDQTIELRSLINNDTDFWNIFKINTTTKVTITAADQANDLVSNPITFNVTTHPNKSLSLTVSNNLQFKDINYGDRTEYFGRKSKFDLQVTSMREPWKLSVSTNGLYLNGQTHADNFALIYKKSATADSQILSSSPTQIASDTVSHDADYTDNISDDWKEDSGLLLKQLGINQAGHYTGTTTWTAEDTPTN